MKITIKEIAEIAGVHRATVDKVLHNRVGVSDEVRQRIQKIIREVGYIPNPTGRALQKQGKTYQITAILVDVDAMPYLQQGIAQGIKKMAGFDIAIDYHITSFQDIDSQCSYLSKAIASKVDGILLSPSNSDRIRQAIQTAEKAGIPVVTINSDIEDSKRLCYVGHNGLQAGRIAGRMLGLFLNGTGEIGIVTSSINSENNNFYVRAREQSFNEFITSHYPNISIVARIESYENKLITYQKTVELLANFPSLQGLYITCGGASEVGRALKDTGRDKQVKVLSFEDYPEILQLIQEDVIHCTFATNLQAQGENGLCALMEYLIFGTVPQPEQFTEIKILVKESIF